MIIKATKKPVTIECVKWDGENIEEIMAFCGDSAFTAVESQMGQTETEELYIKTLEGNHHASVGDYIIKGVKGEFYPCKPDIFENTYDIVDESGPIVKVRAEVRYYEDSIVNGEKDISWNEQEKGVKPRMHCVVKREGENIKPEDSWNWCLEIDPQNGVILNWPKGNTAHVHYKVCDGCHADYFLNGKKICDNEKDGYVPDFLCPADSGYGDYMIMDIDEEGHIADWSKTDFEDWVKTMTSSQED